MEAYDRCGVFVVPSHTNKHVLPHCSSPVVLDRYKKRHDDVLSVLANWVKGALKDGGRLYVDLSERDIDL